MQSSRRPVCAIGLAAASVLAAAGTAQAQLSGADVGVNPTYEQTGPGPADVTSTGGFFSARVFFMDPGDYTGGTVTFPGGGSGSLTSEGANVIGYGASNTSLSQLQADYPDGGYGYDVTGSQPEATFTINYAGDAYSNVPYITNFSALEDMDAKDPFTVEFNTYVPGPNANSSAIYFTISNSSGTVVYNASPFGLPDGTTSVTIPAGTLVAGGSYTFDLLYDNRINGSTDVTGDGTPDSIQVTQFYDTHTDGVFTPVPEPSTWAMMLIGFVGLGFAGYRSGRVRWGGAVPA